ncbi:hypothetical protein [Sagittula salina]|uniref:Uncharacterized protein n=1 Tax=Sagittula salina TaxID=2820268 RepID=A0A940MRM1_9RHOB|nr:hypothetical protein [Sagittula salina]MBP0484678.1 hypothetical protein [Sagittula salina]
MSGGAFLKGLTGGYVAGQDIKDRRTLHDAIYGRVLDGEPGAWGGGDNRGPGRGILEALGIVEPRAQGDGDFNWTGERFTPSGNGVDASPDVLNQSAPASWEQERAGIFDGESKGDYDALFGFSNREGGRFSNIKLTDMTVDDAIRFSNPKGEYAQWVASRNDGTVATPMGGFQIVGKTLRGVKKGMGLKGNERMTPALQDAMGLYIRNTQGLGAWEGYKGPSDPSRYAARPGTTVAPAVESVALPSAAPQAAPQAAAPASDTMSDMLNARLGRGIATGAPVGTYNFGV